MNSCKIYNKSYNELKREGAILNKIKELANRIVTENAEKYNSKNNQKEVDFSEWNLASQILNIIEGDLKIMDKEELKKEDIEIAKEDLNFMHEGDYITKEMEQSKNIILEYIQQLEERLEMKTYKEWCKIFTEKSGMKILDNDGFRDIENFNENMEFTRYEFNKRLMLCTLISV